MTLPDEIDRGNSARSQVRACLVAINDALNYWYPTKVTSDEEERAARQRRFEFRDKLEKEMRK